MADSIHLEIADVDFAVGSAVFDIFQGPGKAYQSFLGKGNNRSGVRSIGIQIDLKLGEIPSIKSMQKLFDSDQSWSMFQNHDEYCLSLYPPTFKKPIWSAIIDKDFSKATVYCNEPMVNNRNGKPVVFNPVRYPLDQLLLMHILAHRKGALLHAAGVEITGKGYIFPGKSGAGKSTLTEQFSGRHEFEFLSDDRIIVRKVDHTFISYGTPWPGDAGIAINKNVPLAGIFFINHGSKNTIKDINPKQAIARLLPVTSIPWYDREIMPKILDFCEDLVLNVPAYELDFKPSVEVVDVLEKFIST